MTQNLYVEGERLDLNEGTEVTLTIKSNFMRDINDLTGNMSSTISLPKTANNLRILGHPDTVRYDTNNKFPYEKHACRFERNGVYIVDNGTLTVTGAKDGAIDVCITWGLCDALNAIKTNDATIKNAIVADGSLQDIPLDVWNMLNRYDAVVNGNNPVFYAAYDPFQHVNGKSSSWATETVVMSSGAAVRKTVANTLPVLSMKAVIDAVYNAYGLAMQFPQEAEQLISELCLPYCSWQPSEQERKVVKNWDFGYSNNTYTLRWLKTPSWCKNESDNQITVTMAGIYHFEVSADVRATIRIFGNGTYEIVNYRGATINIVVEHENGEADTYTVGTEMVLEHIDGGITINNYIDWNANNRLSSSGEIELQKGDKIHFDFIKPFDGLDQSTVSCQFGNVFVSAGVKEYNIVDNATYPVSLNAPDIKIIDLIRYLSFITASYPMQIGDSNLVDFVTFDSMFNFANAVDWSNYLLGDTDTPKEVQYNYGKWAQRNIYKYKADDKNQSEVSRDKAGIGTHDGYITVNDLTLDKERTVIEFPFAASDNDNVPIIENFNDGDNFKLVDCTPRVMRVIDNGEGYAALTFSGLNVDMILGRDMYRYVQCLNRMRVVKEQFKLSDNMILRFDETTPVYLAQYGQYFAVIEVSSKGNGVADVTLLQLS